MKYAIISDIHGNLEALEAVLEVCRMEKVDQYVCLGDVVGYNANPKECLDIVRALPELTIVKGNHDTPPITTMRWRGSTRMRKPPFSGPVPS